MEKTQNVETQQYATKRKTNGSMKSKRKSNKTSRQMKIKTQLSKICATQQK